MPELSEESVGCPYCGETITILIDSTLEQQNYVEDCEVCCRPIDFDVQIAPDGAIRLIARSDRD